MLDKNEIEYTFIRAAGPGGQNVNKVATAVLLRFNVLHSPSLKPEVKERLVLMLGKRLTQTGDIIIKAMRHRTQEKNKQDALVRLLEWVKRASVSPKKRRKTKPTKSSVERRLTKKKLHSKTKLLRGRKMNINE